MRRLLIGVIVVMLCLTLGYFGPGKISFLKNILQRKTDSEEIRPPDVPYIVTPQAVVDKMLEMAAVTKDDLLYDLGCGDGRIVIAAAKKYGCKAVGYDIDPQCVKESLENVEKNQVGDLVRIEQKDVFTLDLREASVITLYLLPDLNVRLIPQLEKLKPGSRIVSHAFDIEGVEPEKIVDVISDEGKSTIYFWTTPLKKAEGTDPEIEQLCRSVDSAISTFQFEIKCRETIPPVNSVALERMVTVVVTGGKTHVEEKIVPSAGDNKPASSSPQVHAETEPNGRLFDGQHPRQRTFDLDRENIPSPLEFVTHLSFGRGLSYYSGFHIERVPQQGAPHLESLLIYPSRAEEKPMATFLLDGKKGHCWTQASAFDSEGNVTASASTSDFRNVDGVWIPFRVMYERFREGHLIYHRDAEILSAQRIRDGK